MSKINNQKGFAVVEVVLSVLLLAAIGFAGYFAYKDHQNKSTKTASITTVASKPTTTTPASPTAGWKTYTSSYEQASFKYPASWSLSSQPDQLADQTGVNDVTLTSPNGLTLNYSDSVSGLGGGCPPGSPAIMLTKVQELPNAGGTSTVYLVENGGTVGLADSSAWNNEPAGEANTGTCLFYPLVDSKLHSGVQLGFSSAVQFASDKTFTTAQQKDLPTAELILESFQY
jgi:Tfp pilus assembly protein PilE